MGRIISLGWDVAGYTGKKNAFALAKIEDSEIDLRICTNDLKLKDGFYTFPSELFVGSDKVIIAIDAPFGFPSSLLDFINDKNEIGNYYSKDRDNVYAFRATDLEVIKHSGKTPLSPIFDKLGRNTLRVIRQLRKWKQEYEELQVLPWDSETNGNLTAIEVYPGLLAGSNNLYNYFSCIYKTVITNAKGVHTSIKDTFFSSFEKLYKDKIPKKKISNNDEIDAAICALMGLEFAKDKSNLAQFNSSLKYEGKIYMPPMAMTACQQ